MYAFEYQRPSTRDAAKSAASGADVRYLAGGQSLIQAMRLRLSSEQMLPAPSRSRAAASQIPPSTCACCIAFFPLSLRYVRLH